MQELKNQKEPISKVEEVQVQKESTNGDEELIQDKSFFYYLGEFWEESPFEVINKSISNLTLGKRHYSNLLMCALSIISEGTPEKIKNQIKTSIGANSELNSKINNLRNFFTEIKNDIEKTHNFDPIMKIIKEEKLSHYFDLINIEIFNRWFISIIQSNDQLTFECANLVDLFYNYAPRSNGLDTEVYEQPVFIESILKLKLVYRQKNIEINTDMILEIFIKLSNTLGRKLNKNEVLNLLKNFSPYIVVKSEEDYDKKVSEFGGSISKWHSFFNVCEPGSFTKDIANLIFEKKYDEFKNAFAAILKYDKLEIFEEKRPFDGSKLCAEDICDYKSAINFFKLCKKGTLKNIKLSRRIICYIAASGIITDDEFLSKDLLDFSLQCFNYELIYVIIKKFSGDLSEIGLRNLISRCKQSEPFYNVYLDFEDKYNCEIPFLSRFNGTLTEDLILDLSKFFCVDSIINLIKTKFDQQLIPYRIFRPAWHMLEKLIKKNYILKREHFYDKFEKNHVLYLLENCDYKGNMQEFTNIIYSYAILKLDHENIFFKTDYEAFWNTVKTTPTIRQKFLFACIMHIFDTKQFDERTKLLFENLDVKTGFFRRRINLNEIFANEPIMLNTLLIYIFNNPLEANFLKGYFLWDFKAIQIEVHNKNTNTRNSDNDNNQSIALAKSKISDSDSEKQSLKPKIQQAITKTKEEKTNEKELNPGTEKEEESELEDIVI